MRAFVFFRRNSGAHGVHMAAVQQSNMAAVQQSKKKAELVVVKFCDDVSTFIQLFLTTLPQEGLGGMSTCDMLMVCTHIHTCM